MLMDLPDDSATLEAALALIDEWELELGDRATLGASPPSDAGDCDTHSTSAASASDSDDHTGGCGGSSSSLSTNKATAVAAPPSRRRKARDDEDVAIVAQAQMDRREELVFLRRKVRDLEATLSAVRGGSSPVNSESKDIMNGHWAKDLDATWIWQQIASRQLERRQQSERENLRLRVQVEEQIKMAKDLMRVLLRAYQQAQANADVNASSVPFKRVKAPRDAATEVSEQDQLRRVDELMEESGSLFGSKPFTGGLPVFRDVNVMEHVNGESTINVDTSWVVPFPVDLVMSAFWTHLMRKARTGDGPSECGQLVAVEYTGVDDGSELLVTRYESNTLTTKFVGKFFGRFVAKRRHPTENQPGIIIMDMCADPIACKPMSMEGVRIHYETQLRVVWADQASDGEPLPSASSTGGGRMSLVQMSHRMHVQLAASDTPTRRRRVGALTNYLMYNVESELDWKQDLLETLLVRSATSTPMTFPVNK